MRMSARAARQASRFRLTFCSAFCPAARHWQRRSRCDSRRPSRAHRISKSSGRLRELAAVHPGACGTIDASGLFIAPAAAPIAQSDRNCGHQFRRHYPVRNRNSHDHKQPGHLLTLPQQRLCGHGRRLYFAGHRKQLRCDHSRTGFHDPGIGHGASNFLRVHHAMHHVARFRRSAIAGKS